MSDAFHMAQNVLFPSFRLQVCGLFYPKLLLVFVSLTNVSLKVKMPIFQSLVMFVDQYHRRMNFEWTRKQPIRRAVSTDWIW